MKLFGRIVKDTKTVKDALAENNDDTAAFRDRLEECFISLCAELDVPVPLWLKKNTKEFAAYRRTFFTPEQFLEEVTFDRLEIRVET
ncbi:MAG: hypothetical protein N2489_10315 [Clostridia bacterium]|nr:hypothetical protein [Clostridia bacterium]